MFMFGGTIDNNVRSAEMFRFQFASYPKCTLHEDFGRLLSNRLFCDLEFIVGPEETRIPSHAAMIAARSEFLRTRIRQAREKRNLYLEEVYGTADVPVKDLPLLEVSDLIKYKKRKKKERARVCVSVKRNIFFSDIINDC